jgi:DNA-binding transcriptional LysR family regulator
VRRGQVELALTPLPAERDPLTTRALWEQEIVIALPPPLAAGLPDPVPLDAIAAVPLVLEFAGGRSLVDERLDRAIGTVAVECAHPQAVWALVAHGAGATILPRRVAEAELPGVVVRSIEPRLLRTVGFVLRPGPLSPAAAAFLEVAELMRPEYAAPPAG